MKNDISKSVTYKHIFLRNLLILLCGLFVASTSASASLGQVRFSFLPALHLGSSGSSGTGLQVVSLYINQFSISAATSTSSLGVVVSSTAFVPFGMTGSPLNFPNPFSFNRAVNSGYSVPGTQIGYELSSAASSGVEISIYDMFGNRIYEKYIPPGLTGTLSGYNKVAVGVADIGYQMPAGVYFYFIRAEDELLGRGKMMVVP